MNTKFFMPIVFVLAMSIVSLSAMGQDSVIIIRHGEKPAKGDNLTCKGLNRALGIPAVLTRQFSVPMYTYVPALKCDKETKHSRMFETVMPMAVRYNLTVNSKHAQDDIKGVSSAVSGKLSKNPGTILLVWEHKNIQPLAVAMGVADAQPWADDDFDSIWIITGAGTKHAKLTIGHEGLNGVSENCPK